MKNEYRYRYVIRNSAVNRVNLFWLNVQKICFQDEIDYGDFETVENFEKNYRTTTLKNFVQANEKNRAGKERIT
jgi:hypothetical protein